MKNNRGAEIIRVPFKSTGTYVIKAANTHGKRLFVHSMFIMADVNSTDVEVRSNGVKVFADMHLEKKGSFITLQHNEYAWIECSHELTIVSTQLINGFVVLTEE